VLEGGGVTLVSDYVEGAPLTTLARLLTTGREARPPGTLVRIVLDALAGLEATGDEPRYQPGGFTPDAVMVCSDGRSRLIEPMVQAELGAPRSLGRHQNRVAYRAPEQFDDRVIADGRADVFTFGVILFELLHRKRLFAGLGYDDIAKRVRGAKIPRSRGSASCSRCWRRRWRAILSRASTAWRRCAARSLPRSATRVTRACASSTRSCSAATLRSSAFARPCATSRAPPQPLPRRDPGRRAARRPTMAPATATASR
jgi:hypothetical protein